MPRQPLELLAKQRRAGLGVAAQEQDRGQNIKGSVVGGSSLVEPVSEQARGLARVHHPEPEACESDAGQVDERQQNAATEVLQPLLGEAEGKVQKKRRLQGFSGDIRPEDHQVQPFQAARELEGIKDERYQAEKIEVRGAQSAPAAEQDVEANEQIDQADDAQSLRQRAVERNRDQLDGRIERNAVACDCVINLSVDAGAVKDALQVRKLSDGNFVAGGAGRNCGD